MKDIVGLVVCRLNSFPNSTTRTHRRRLRPDQTHGQNPYMSRLNRHVYDQTKSADLSETRADLTDFVGDQIYVGLGLRQSPVGPV